MANCHDGRAAIHLEASRTGSNQYALKGDGAFPDTFTGSISGTQVSFDRHRAFIPFGSFHGSVKSPTSMSGTGFGGCEWTLNKD
jgi:hypothetical protein